MRAVTTPLPDLVLYSRPGCHLCEDARVILDALLAGRAAAGLPSPALVERSIDGNDELHRRYAFTIPVISYRQRELELATSRSRLAAFLAEVLDGSDPETAP